MQTSFIHWKSDSFLSLLLHFSLKHVRFISQDDKNCKMPNGMKFYYSSIMISKYYSSQ